MEIILRGNMKYAINNTHILYGFCQLYGFLIWTYDMSLYKSGKSESKRVGNGNELD